MIKKIYQMKIIEINKKNIIITIMIKLLNNDKIL
jgi:hypothetical protein